MASLQGHFCIFFSIGNVPPNTFISYGKKSIHHNLHNQQRKKINTTHTTKKSMPTDQRKRNALARRETDLYINDLIKKGTSVNIKTLSRIIANKNLVEVKYIEQYIRDCFYPQTIDIDEHGTITPMTKKIVEVPEESPNEQAPGE